jgi:glycosyltransferase involved in cell wall biosynthesis
MLPLVSIIIPCYNSERFIEEAINSAIDQTYKNIEVIVINDCSTDKSLDIITSFSSKIHIENFLVNQGVQRARNRGIELAKGEYIKFLDSDDVLFLDCIEKQIFQSLELASQSKAIVYGDAIWVDEQLKPIVGYPTKSRQLNQDPIEFIIASSPLTSSPLHKREYLIEVGGFDPFLINRHENNLHLRLVLEKVNFIYYPCLTYQYRQYNASKRISQFSYAKNGSMYYFDVLQREKAFLEQKLGTNLSPEIRRLLSRDFWVYGRAILREGYSLDSQKYFEEARKFDNQNCVVGNFPYPLLVKLFNPFLAESLMKILYNIIKCMRLS